VCDRAGGSIPTQGAIDFELHASQRSLKGQSQLREQPVPKTLIEVVAGRRIKNPDSGDATANPSNPGRRGDVRRNHRFPGVEKAPGTPASPAGFSTKLIDHATDLEIPFRTTPVTSQLLDRGLREGGALLPSLVSDVHGGAGVIHVILDSVEEHNRPIGRHRRKIRRPPMTQNDSRFGKPSGRSAAA
jgi:hypothetical protein